MVRLESVVNAVWQIGIGYSVIAVAKVQQKIGLKNDLVVPHQVAKSHQCRALKTIERVVVGCPVYKVGSEVQFVFVRHKIAFTIFVVCRFKKRDGGTRRQTGVFLHLLLREDIVPQIGL